MLAIHLLRLRTLVTTDEKTSEKQWGFSTVLFFYYYKLKPFLHKNVLCKCTSIFVNNA